MPLEKWLKTRAGDDWMFQVMWLLLTNQIGLLQGSIVMERQNLFMKSAPENATEWRVFINQLSHIVTELNGKIKMVASVIYL